MLAIFVGTIIGDHPKGRNNIFDWQFSRSVHAGEVPVSCSDDDWLCEQMCVAFQYFRCLNTVVHGVQCKAGALVVLHGANVHLSHENTSPYLRHAYSMHVVEGSPTTAWSSDNWCALPVLTEHY